MALWARIRGWERTIWNEAERGVPPREGRWSKACKTRGLPSRLEEILRSRREEILKIAAKNGARNVRIFGSVARGQADSESDLDILVEFTPDSTLLNQSAMIRELESLLGMKVDVVSDRGLRERIRERVLNEAVPL